MSLFQGGDFTLHSGSKSDFKIDCDALTDVDWDTLAILVTHVVQPFSAIYGVWRGGLKFAAALEPHRTPRAPHRLLVDDVLTTGLSMQECWVDEDDIGAVVFARGPCPSWVTPLFQITPGLHASPMGDYARQLGFKASPYGLTTVVCIHCQAKVVWAGDHMRSHRRRCAVAPQDVPIPGSCNA